MLTQVLILGGGPNRIGQGIEFDYCCCHASFSLRCAEFVTCCCVPEPIVEMGQWQSDSCCCC